MVFACQIQATDRAIWSCVKNVFPLKNICFNNQQTILMVGFNCHLKIRFLAAVNWDLKAAKRNLVNNTSFGSCERRSTVTRTALVQ